MYLKPCDILGFVPATHPHPLQPCHNKGILLKSFFLRYPRGGTNTTEMKGGKGEKERAFLKGKVGIWGNGHLSLE